MDAVTNTKFHKIIQGLRLIEYRKKNALHRAEASLPFDVFSKFKDLCEPSCYYEMGKNPLNHYPDGNLQASKLSQITQQTIAAEAMVVKALHQVCQGEHNSTLRILLAESGFESGSHFASLLNDQLGGIKLGPGFQGIWSALDLIHFFGGPKDCNAMSSLENRYTFQIERIHWREKSIWEKCESPLQYLPELVGFTIEGIVHRLVPWSQRTHQCTLTVPDFDRFELSV